MPVFLGDMGCLVLVFVEMASSVGSCLGLLQDFPPGMAIASYLLQSELLPVAISILAEFSQIIPLHFRTVIWLLLVGLVLGHCLGIIFSVCQVC